VNFERAVARRDFLKGLAFVPIASAAGAWPSPQGELVNDIHTGLNPTTVNRVVRPASTPEIQALIKDCRKHGTVISVSGSRHAAGGQQFAADSLLLDMRSMNRVLGLDEKTGILQAEAGIEWPELIQGYLDLQKGNERWGIHQKQGGADRMTLGGTLSANAHGHALGSGPIVGDVEWIDLILPDGTKQRCSRTENRELFSLAIGGYGLFGVITTVGLRLVPRRKLRRRVEARTTAEAIGLIERRTAAGKPYGYFQYSIDETSPDFLRAGVLTTYEPVSAETPLGSEGDIDTDTLVSLLQLAHRDRGAAYRRYAKFELAKDGNVEWSDLHQLAAYKPGYHQTVDERAGDGKQGADLIAEVYVPRNELIPFLEDARRILLTSAMPLVYGTVRFIERDKDSFLPWARKRYACVIFCPHTLTDKDAMRKTTGNCQQLMRAAMRRGGSFYLTYNRFATRDDLSQSYPQFPEFLMLKKKYDPMETLQSEWYRYYRDLHK
jgi:FAD/FMN-containing dehydrogenase